MESRKNLYLFEVSACASLEQRSIPAFCDRLGGGVWRFSNPVGITFGVGCLGRLPERLGGRPYVLVTYDGARFRELADRLDDLCGPPSRRITGIEPNPDLEDLARIDAGFPAAAEVVVALGGGSVIDAAKVLAAGRGDLVRVRRYLLEGRGELEPLPLIALPTTAGTGSEVTSWATVWDRRAQSKHSLAHPRLYPEHALVDPALTLGAPREVTLAAGLDALSHALESLWNRNHNPVSASLAVPAARTVLEALPALLDDLEDLGLRTRMAEASLLAGLAFSNTKTALAHSISYPITLRAGTAHGIACAFSLPRVLGWAWGADPACDRALEAILGPGPEAAAEWLTDFLEGLGVATEPSAYGLDERSFAVLVHEALAGERGRNFNGHVPRLAMEERRTA